jgi:hypothetical protein
MPAGFWQIPRHRNMLVGIRDSGSAVQVCAGCGQTISGRYRFCPWCAAPLRSKLVEFFHPHPAFEGEGGRALRVSRYLTGDGDERHVRLSIWDDESTAESVIPLEEAEAERLARFLLEPAGRARSRSVWGRLTGLLR